jgi:hypothetical protein
MNDQERDEFRAHMKRYFANKTDAEIAADVEAARPKRSRCQDCHVWPCDCGEGKAYTRVTKEHCPFCMKVNCICKPQLKRRVSGHS